MRINSQDAVMQAFESMTDGFTRPLPSMLRSEIASAAGIRPDVVRSAIQGLRKRGLLDWDVVGGRSGPCTTPRLYRFSFPAGKTISPSFVSNGMSVE